MNVQRSFVRIIALTVVIAMPLLGLSGVASAKATKASKGSSAWCAKHAKHAKNAACKNAGGAATGGGTDPITVTAVPNPLVETGQSEVDAVIQVSTSPAYAGDTVLISSSQLDSSCFGGVKFFSISANGGTPTAPGGSSPDIAVILDDDGNATVTVIGADCAPGSDVIEADLEDAPYDTALTTLVVNPPVVTTAGVTAFPATEVETGDTTASGESDIYTVFYVETSPVYAEQPVTISSAQLQQRCGQGWTWVPGNELGAGGAYSYAASDTTATAETTLDDDGNAVFVFYGASCAAGESQVLAEVDAGTHPTYVTTFTVSPPAPGSTTTTPPPPVP